MNILEAMADPHLFAPHFAGSSWAAWRDFLAALFALLQLVAVYLACFRDYRPYLAPGEKATIAIIAANRSQARSIFRFTIGLLKAVPLIEPMVIDFNTETIELANSVIIEIATARTRLVRQGG
jgi:hypothetical protein